VPSRETGYIQRPMMGLEKKLSPLFRLAIKSGAADAVALHIRRGESLNGRDTMGLTPLMIAAIHNQKESCATLLAFGADVSLTMRENSSMLPSS
jgi:ankyrin repeat protein